MNIKNRYILFPLTAAGISFAIFVFAGIFVALAVEPQYLFLLPLLLPTAIFLLIALAKHRRAIRDSTAMVATFILLLLLIPAWFFYSLYLMMIQSTKLTDDVRYYSRAFDTIDYRDEIGRVFPEEIPEDAEDVEFTYIPGFLQGGEELRLSYKTDSIDEWANRLSSSVEWSGSVGEYEKLTGSSMFTADADDRMYLLFNEGYNHGKQCYATIDERMSRVSFYYCHW